MSRLNASELNDALLHGPPRGAHSTDFNALTIPSTAFVFDPIMMGDLETTSFASSAVFTSWFLPEDTVLVGERICVDAPVDCNAPVSEMSMAAISKDVDADLHLTIDFTHVLATTETLDRATVDLLQSEAQDTPLRLISVVLGPHKQQVFAALGDGTPFYDAQLTVKGFSQGVSYDGLFRVRPFDSEQIRDLSHAG